ncbi:MAG: hypothetical protein ACHQYP_11140, partial [Nitrospiria bacterium]
IFGIPGVTPEDVVILQGEMEILGYAVLGPEGFVLEFVVDPRLSHRERFINATFLIKAIEERSLSRGDDAILFEVPFSDESICQALQKSDYYNKKATEYLNILILDLVGFLSKIIGHRQQHFKIPDGWSPTFLINVKSGLYRFCPIENLSIQIGPPLVVKEVKADSSFSAKPTLKIDLSTLTDLIFKLTTFEKTMSEGGLVIPKISDVKDVKVLMSLIAIDSSWFTLFGDYQ